MRSCLDEKGCVPGHKTVETELLDFVIEEETKSTAE